MQFIFKDKTIAYSVMDDNCPICGSNLVLKKQREKDGCIKVRYFHCVECDFDTRLLEIK